MASDSFAQYLKEAARYPLLDKSQEILLARQVQTWLHDPEATPRQKKAGQRAYEKLINCNLEACSLGCEEVFGADQAVRDARHSAGR